METHSGKHKGPPQLCLRARHTPCWTAAGWQSPGDLCTKRKQLGRNAWGSKSLSTEKWHEPRAGMKRCSDSPGWCRLVDWAPACEPEGRQFDSQPGHMPGLRARSPVGDMWGATTHWCFSPSLSPSLSRSINKQTNKQNLKKERERCSDRSLKLNNF